MNMSESDVDFVFLFDVVVLLQDPRGALFASGGGLSAIVYSIAELQT